MDPSWTVAPGDPAGGGLRDTAAHYALLPLRLFLAVTFLYAGLDKLTDPAFLAADGPGSIGELLRGAANGAAVPGLIDMALNDPVAFAWAISIGELAVGAGTLFGLWTRLAALGGTLISLSFWLTISWDVGPYYYSQDLPYVVAWVTLVLAGAPNFSLDAVLTARRGRYGRHVYG